MNIFQIIGAIIILFFLPGYTFITMLFPKRGELDLEYDQLYRIGLGMGMSIVISILVGYILGYYGFFYSQYLWIVLGNLSLFFFLIGFYRGGYPYIRRLMGLEMENKYDRIIVLSNLLKERKKMIRKLNDVERILKMNPVNREYHERERDEILKDIEKIDKEIDILRRVVDEI